MAGTCVSMIIVYEWLLTASTYHCPSIMVSDFCKIITLLPWSHRTLLRLCKIQPAEGNKDKITMPRSFCQILPERQNNQDILMSTHRGKSCLLITYPGKFTCKCSDALHVGDKPLRQRNNQCAEKPTTSATFIATCRIYLAPACPMT